MTIDRKFDVFHDEKDRFGISIKGTQNKGFDAFWLPQQIFHDSFEHWFEDVPFKGNPFVGSNAFTIYGEIAALGASLYYHQYGHVWNRPIGNGADYYVDSVFYDISNLLTQDQESMDRPPENYQAMFDVPAPWQCPVSNQPPLPNTDDYFDIVRTVVIDGRKYSVPFKEYHEPIVQCLRWGAWMAKRMCRKDMCCIIDDLEDFTKRVDPEELLSFTEEFELRYCFEHGQYIYERFKDISKVSSVFDLLP